MRSIKTFLLLTVFLTGLFVLAVDVAAQTYYQAQSYHWPQTYHRYSSRGYSFGGARPVTGYGSNLHRRFVLKQESQRARQGKRVRYHGNIRWARR